MTKRAADIGLRKDSISPAQQKNAATYRQLSERLAHRLNYVLSAMRQSLSSDLISKLDEAAQRRSIAALRRFDKSLDVLLGFGAAKSSKSTGQTTSAKSPKAGRAGSPKRKRAA